MMINSTQLASFFTKFTKELDQETEFFLCHKLNKGQKKKKKQQIHRYTILPTLQERTQLLALDFMKSAVIYNSKHFNLENYTIKQSLSLNSCHPCGESSGTSHREATRYCKKVGAMLLTSEKRQCFFLNFYSFVQSYYSHFSSDTLI